MGRELNRHRDRSAGIELQSCRLPSNQVSRSVSCFYRFLCESFIEVLREKLQRHHHHMHACYRWQSAVAMPEVYRDR